MYIISIFCIPLEAKGMCVASIQDEREGVVSYGRKYLPIGSENYRKIWYKLLMSPDSGRWPNILILCELLFSIPISTSRVEQLFSLLKVIKTKHRTSLNNSTLHALWRSMWRALSSFKSTYYVTCYEKQTICNFHPY